MKLWMEERAISNPGRITKAQFLIEIERPYIEGLSSEKIKKAFEVTGTWPVDDYSPVLTTWSSASDP